MPHGIRPARLTRCAQGLGEAFRHGVCSRQGHDHKDSGSMKAKGLRRCARTGGELDASGRGSERVPTEETKSLTQSLLACAGARDSRPQGSRRMAMWIEEDRRIYRREVCKAYTPVLRRDAPGRPGCAVDRDRGDTSRCHPSHTTGHTGHVPGGSTGLSLDTDMKSGPEPGFGVLASPRLVRSLGSRRPEFHPGAPVPRPVNTGSSAAFHS